MQAFTIIRCKYFVATECLCIPTISDGLSWYIFGKELGMPFFFNHHYFTGSIGKVGGKFKWYSCEAANYLRRDWWMHKHRIISSRSWKQEAAESELTTERDKVVTLLKMFTTNSTRRLAGCKGNTKTHSRNQKLRYRITHLIRAVKDADSKLAA